jgi:hypothetical protein
MKKNIVLFFLFMFNVNFGQCNLNSIFLFELGKNKFDISNEISKNRNLKYREMDAISKSFNNQWRTYDYLKNDSIYRVNLILDHRKTECFRGYENRMYLNFADDILYRINIVQEFSIDKYEEMMELYNNYIEEFLSLHNFYTIFSTVNNTNEKIGEGYKFINDDEKYKNSPKVELVRISYSIEYKSFYEPSQRKYIKSSEVDYYILEIDNINLNGTKLTNQGY